MQLLTIVCTSLAAGIMATATPTSLPPCSMVDRPCKCPPGTTFKNLTTYGVIGAPARDVQDIMGSFFDLQFQGGLVPSSTKGKDNVPGAVRSFNFSGPAGYYVISEQLTRWKTSPDGSFNQQYQQSPKPPVVQVPGAGAYHGGWTSIVGQQTVVRNETAIAWKNWRCETGETFPSATSHEGGITNTSAVLEKQGKLTGVSIAAFTIFNEVRDD
ncbi:hypothetical protein ATEIFO6365_0011001900 [Aspergillus terreus]|uniref:Uncharacterized protein n=1 Tax=Aspergillus terreus TaxID=33178 RepID=A0A5M3YXZ6_ASPTE|nr:hypothetical protein [Aspergillus terreus]GES61360.1 hypothetical protein ATETN484_0006001900 [Aspergillus terreus]GFF19760.1 hypothetical protein ATEIFO6365_0011001900 [Aspergillus terreus]